MFDAMLSESLAPTGVVALDISQRQVTVLEIR